VQGKAGEQKRQRDKNLESSLCHAEIRAISACQREEGQDGDGEQREAEGIDHREPRSSMAVIERQHDHHCEADGQSQREANEAVE
jgi:hypothetical protein